MKLKDYILQSVLKYPGLYLSNSYEQSRKLVLNHVFLTNGNGMEWAYTKDKTKGGYAVHPQYYKKNGKYIRKFDLPYNKIQIADLSWDEMVKFGIAHERNEWIEHLKKTNNKRSDIQTENFIRLMMENFPEKNDIEREPYPIYDKGWLFHDIETGKIKIEEIQPDWMAGMIEIIQWAHSFYSDEVRYSKSKYYGINDLNRLEEYIEKKQKAWSEILVDYEIYDIDVPENNFEALRKALLNIRRKKYVDLTENALKTLTAK